MNWIPALLLLLALAAYFRLRLPVWLGLAGALFAALAVFAPGHAPPLSAWLLYLALAGFLLTPPLRRALLSRHLFQGMRKVMPAISRTEQEALDAGDVWWEAELFSGKPDFDRIRLLPRPVLSKEEQDFLDGPVETFCRMLDDWKITHELYDLPEECWQYAREHRFFAMIIPKQYGGLDYSALCHSQAVLKIGSRSGSAGVTVMVPNSLGPGKLLMTYGTEEQKDYYLPRLASGEEIPCFGLTGPDAGSDAGAMPDSGIVCRGEYQGENDVLGIRLNFEKRYITLAPVATLLGIAFKLYDPDHLLGEEEDRGITLALIRRDTPGIEIGKRHFPANQAFMNGPIRGRDVFIPLDAIIGGEKYIGKGWSMLMECLGDGRAISLPALGTAAAKMACRYTGAYARIRSQFHTPIGKFEGVEEVLTQIAGQAYAIDSARLMILSALDSGIVPSVLSGVVKQQSMERMRKVVNHAMDVHGGHGICMGPHNLLGRGYQLIPVGITVEGANILTRSMIVFGQGAMRSHPYLFREVSALHNPDRRAGLAAFDRALFAHIGFVISNTVRSFWLGLTGARLVATPGNVHTARYYRQIVRMSAAFALLSDVCLAVLGGSLKRREKLSGRLADIIANLYFCSAALKHYEDEGEQAADLPLLQWACEDALYHCQQAMKQIMRNLPAPLVGRLCNVLIFPLTKPYHQPSDALGKRVAEVLLKPSPTLDRLCRGIFESHDRFDAAGRISHALQLVLATENIEQRLRQAYKEGRLQQRDRAAWDEALDLKLISDEEYRLLQKARVAVQNAIRVDEFVCPGWRVDTPMIDDSASDDPVSDAPTDPARAPVNDDSGDSPRADSTSTIQEAS